MVFNKIIKVMVLILAGLVIYFRDHYYLFIIAGIVFLAYKFNLHNRTYKLINKVSGNTKTVVKDRNKKNKYIKKYLKYNNGEI